MAEQPWKSNSRNDYEDLSGEDLSGDDSSGIAREQQMPSAAIVPMVNTPPANTNDTTNTVDEDGEVPMTTATASGNQNASSFLHPVHNPNQQNGPHGPSMLFNTTRTSQTGTAIHPWLNPPNVRCLRCSGSHALEHCPLNWRPFVVGSSQECPSCRKTGYHRWRCPYHAHQPRPCQNCGRRNHHAWGCRTLHIPPPPPHPTCPFCYAQGTHEWTCPRRQIHQIGGPPSLVGLQANTNDPSNDGDLADRLEPVDEDEEDSAGPGYLGTMIDQGQRVQVFQDRPVQLLRNEQLRRYVVRRPAIYRGRSYSFYFFNAPQSPAGRADCSLTPAKKLRRE